MLGGFLVDPIGWRGILGVVLAISVITLVSIACVITETPAPRSPARTPPRRPPGIDPRAARARTSPIQRHFRVLLRGDDGPSLDVAVRLSGRDGALQWRVRAGVRGQRSGPAGRQRTGRACGRHPRGTRARLRRNHRDVHCHHRFRTAGGDRRTTALAMSSVGANAGAASAVLAPCISGSAHWYRPW
ncbi:hypothetical protein [Gordonia oryzae]|uniref:hypothetical protein n=1 Tax=Gordonia oryzae TaxID=2487349 RepID=UPI003CCC64F8